MTAGSFAIESVSAFHLLPIGLSAAAASTESCKVSSVLMAYYLCGD